jgi:hypothetical protein
MATSFFRRHLNGLQPLRGLAARALRLCALALLASLWFGALPVLVGVALLLVAHPARFYPHPILAVEDVVYVWVMGFTSVQFAYRCLMLGMLGEGPMRQALDRMWVRALPLLALVQGWRPLVCVLWMCWGWWHGHEPCRASCR